ncbi:MAG: hypothetical protein AAF657_27450 [Acidobacteriota bacterium]
MSLLSDLASLGGKVVSEVLTIDDLVAGQGVLGQGVSNLTQVGRWGAGSVLVSSNLAARTFQLGVQTGAKTAGFAAAAAEGVVPGAGAARQLAEKVGAQATAAAEEASQLMTHGIELSSGRSPVSPLNQEIWMSKQVPRGYSWIELAADTVVGPYGKIAALPLALSRDTAQAAAATRPGRMAVDATMQALNSLFDLGSASGQIDRAEVRDALLAVTGRTGTAVVRDLLAIAEAAVRFTLGDTRRIERGMREGLEELRLLAEHSEIGDLLPVLPISATLRARARKVVENPPANFLAAIAERPPQVGEVLTALVQDAAPLRHFAVNFPQVITLLGAHNSLVLAAGLVDVGEIEPFVRGGAEEGAPWSALQFEDFVGQAVYDSADPQLGYYPETAVHLARDVSFLYSSDVLGREKAIARAERLYGNEAAARLAGDVSLELDILRADGDKARERRIGDRIESLGSAELIEKRDRGQEQLASLEAFVEAPFQYVPRQVSVRIDSLRYFLSRTHQELALSAAAKGQAGARRDARQALAEWAGDGDGGAASQASAGKKSSAKIES